MHDAKVEARIRRKFRSVAVELDERRRRQWAAAEAQEVGWGGISLVARATGLSRPTIMAGLKDLQLSSKSRTVAAIRVRCPGGGRRASTQTDPGLLEALEQLIEPTTRGDPMSPLRWTCKSTANLAEELTRQNHPVSDRTVALLLKQSGYSLQANRKTREGSSHPDRNAQFEYINRQVRAFQRRRQPVISVDTKKKELVGEFKNPGEEWQPKGQPEKVNVHDFPDPKLGKAIPYGVYDLACNEGWVSVGIDHDTAEFACASIRRWWNEMGSGGFRGNRTVDHGGRRRQQQQPQSAVEEVPAGFGRRVGHHLACLSFSARHQQMEQDRASLVLLHHQELARPSAHHLRGHRQPDREHDHEERASPSAPRSTLAATKLASLSATKNSRASASLARFHGDWNYSIKPRRRNL